MGPKYRAIFTWWRTARDGASWSEINAAWGALYVALEIE